MATSSTLLFDDIFSVHTIDPSGKKFDRVSRVCAHSRNADMELTLDVNTQIYPLQVSDSFSLALASSLFPDQESRTNEAWLMRPGESGLADDYEYVMYGKVYKFDEGRDKVVTVYASFGGLLMSLRGNFRHLSGISVDERVFLLIRR